MFSRTRISTENFSTSQRKSRRNLFLKSSVIQIRVACKTFRRKKEKRTLEEKKRKRERDKASVSRSTKVYASYIFTT